ncbi:MAG: carboxypeptidase-like regulatory domain-containing protein [Bryobacteraceae bacterium]|jgi:protocatechuate 3,4-dioxygenase beta subunit
MSKLSLLLAICSVLACAQETPTAAETAKKASIEGAVVNELTKEPIRRAEISLYGQDKPGGMGGAYSAVTDAAGKFRIENIDPGDYQLVHRKPGFMTSRAYFGQSARVLKLAAGDSLTNLRYSLLPQAIINGRVVDDEGEPVQGVSVMLLRYEYYRGSYRAISRNRPRPQQTNDRGEFRFTDILPGKYYLKADDQRWRLASPGAAARPSTATGVPRTDFVPTYFPNAPEIAQAVKIEVQAGQELSGRDIALRKEKVVRVTGKVLDASGSSVRRAFAWLTPADVTIAGVGSVAVIGLMVDEKGTFAADSVPPGQYIARASKSDAQNFEQSAETPVAVGDTDVENVVLQIQPALETKGAFVLEGSERKDFDFADFSVYMRPMGDTPTYGASAQAKPDGTLTLSRIPPGHYILDVWPESGEGYVKSILIGSEDVYGKEVEAAAVAAGGLKIVIRLDSAAVSGTVEIPEERKAALRSPSVVLLAADAHLRDSAQRHVAQLNQNNGYELKNLRPGDYLAFAFENLDYDSLLDPEVFAAIASKGTKVTLAANESKSLDLKILRWPEQFADRLQ